MSFLVPEMRRNFGGCAGSIAFNLQLLGGDGLMGTVGSDFAPYAQWLDSHAIAVMRCSRSRAAIRRRPTSPPIRTTTRSLRFTPTRAMNFAHETGRRVQRCHAQDGFARYRLGMVEHATPVRRRRYPFIFDPGQGNADVRRQDLDRFVKQATWLAFNDYEAKLMQEHYRPFTGQLAHRVRR